MTSLFGLLSKLARCASGSAIVEATIVIPIAISLMAGGVDFGMAFYADATIGKSVRDAARYLGSLPPNVTCSAWAVSKAQNLAIYGNVAGDGSELISGWTRNGGADNHVTVTVDDCSNPSTVTVSARAPYTTLMLGAILPSVGTLTLSAQHVEQVVSD
jgi:Flp pilus assembly protein TadG